jgi:hypothetical protein
MPDIFVKRATLDPWINGAEYRRSHKASVIAILGAEAPPVYSRGSKFYSIDRWTARFLVEEMGTWAKSNPGGMPTHDVVSAWVQKVNAKARPHREIVIANTPNVLPRRVALALTGGAYHESFHPKYSCRRDLDVLEIISIVIPRWAKISDWSKYTKSLLKWQNICDDIWIERHGTAEFEGTYSKMCELADFILSREETNWEECRNETGAPPTAIRIIQATFRELGKGYPTDKVKERLDSYHKDNEEAFNLVVHGPLRPMLDEILAAPVDDDLASLRVAMDVLVQLAELSHQDDEKDQSEDGDPGDGEQKCPQCDAEAKYLKVRPKPNGRGGVVPGVGIVTCTKCGWQDEVKVSPKKDKGSGGGNKGKDKSEGPDIKGFGNNSLDPKDKDDPKDKNDPKDAAGSGGEDDGDTDVGDTDVGAGGDGSGNEGEGGDGDASGSNGGGEGNLNDLEGHAAGGHFDAGEDFEGYDWEEIAKAAMEKADKDEGLLDVNTALEQAVNEALAKEDRIFGAEEAPWRPYDPGLDIAALVRPSGRGQDNDAKIVDQYLEETKSMCAYLRSRLRTVVHSLEIVHITHGKRRGRGLSGRFITDTVSTLKAHEQPQHAYYDRGVTIDTKMAAAIVEDESISTSNIRELLAKIMLALTEPLDGLNVPTLALGIRDGKNSPRGYSHWGGSLPPGENASDYHRFDGVRYDIFKDWHEKFPTVKWRFANVQSTGGTPLSDGVQYGLMRLSQRDETHRFLFVVTDGQPNPGHEKVINRQIRLATEAGINIIGVGVGNSAVYVKKLFPDSVWSKDIEDIPRLLVAKLNEKVDLFGKKRGCRVARV